MAEQFHQWVQNMPWWEKLYYQLFDPQAITCTTSYFSFAIIQQAFLWLIIAFIAGIITLLILRWRTEKIEEKTTGIILSLMEWFPCVKNVDVTNATTPFLGASNQ